MRKKKKEREKEKERVRKKELVWFLCFNGISTIVGYLIPKLFS